MNTFLPFLVVFGTVTLPALWFLKGLFKWALILALIALAIATVTLGFSLVVRELRRIRNDRRPVYI